MTAQGTTTVEKNLQKVLEKLESARKMQDDWMKNGLNFVDLYVDNAGGDWLSKWGEPESDLDVDKIRGVSVESVKVAIDFADFQKTHLLEIALNHRSHTDDFSDRLSESQTWQDIKYQRQALLGTVIFGAVVTDYLYREYPNLDRNAISTLKSRLADNKQISEFALDLNLNELKLCGTNGTEMNKKEYKKFLCETFQAVFGAIYLECDRDFERAGTWLIQRFVQKAVGENICLIESSKNSPKTAVKRRVILGGDVLDAIAIDYLYNRFPERSAAQLTHWKNILVSKDIFPKEFKAKLGSQYLELGSDFSRTRDWLVDNFIKTAVDELVEETGNQLN
ncbi:ribonuclease III domain-containing protein [Tychonema sp. BBK16]|uniref:ribonuclease III domain-containing protein n=1 Tax=Tychonema sp. BBK16 TaxID=2699888 RepID=UPI0038D26928